MSTQLFTNRDGNTLIKKFEGVFTYVPGSACYDILVGYFLASGYFRVRPLLEKIPKVRILVGIDDLLTNLVTQILDAKRANPSAGMSTLEAEIDLRMYHLYNLNDAEVLLIDSAFALSEAEYLAAGEKMALS